MPAVHNLAETIGFSNSGWHAEIEGLLDPPDKLEKWDKDFVTSRNGQEIEPLEINGDVIVKHSDVKIIRPKARGAIIEDGKMDSIWICPELGMVKGHQPRERQECVRGGGFKMFRPNIYGYIDLFRPRFGDMAIVEGFLHSVFSDPSGFSGTWAHCDPFQPLNNAFDSLLVQDTHFATYPFPPGGTADGSWFGKASGVKPSTSMIILAEYGKSKKMTFRGLYVRGNGSQLAYIINGDDNPDSNPPIDTTFIDILIKREFGRKYYGETAAWNFGGAKKPYPTITYGRVYDADTGAPIPPNYKDSPNAGKIIEAGPSDQYPSMDRNLFLDKAVPPPGPGPTPEPPPDPTPEPPPIETFSIVITEPKPDSMISGSFALKATSGTNVTEYVNVRGRGPDGIVVTFERDRKGTIGGTYDSTKYKAGRWALYVEDDAGKKSPEVMVTFGTTTPTEPPAKATIQELLALLRADAVALRNNSNSTAGDPAERLRSNVGRADLMISRIDAWLVS